MKKVYLMYPEKVGTIAPEIYGHFVEHLGGVVYNGIWVGKDSDIPNIKGFRKEIVDKLKAIKAPVIRWPGGCFAETYDWRDGVGENRPTRVSWWTYADGKYETNQVGTHEFMDFCEAVGADAYFAANLTSVTPMQIRDWMDYCLSPRGSTTLALEREKNGHPEPFHIPYWGVGNENWGGGGRMTPEYYMNEYRRYCTIMENVAPKAQYVVCGEDAKDYQWTHGIAANLGKYTPASGFSMHYYCQDLRTPVLKFDQEQWTKQLKLAAEMEDIICRNWNIICAYGEQKKLKLIVDEWGTWYQEGSGPSKGAKLYEQQCTMREAMISALTLNIFNRHCDKIKMANVAQVVNTLHSLFLADGDKCITTPTYHVFDMYQEHQGAEAIHVFVDDNKEFANSVTVSASVKDGKTLLTVGNLSCAEDAELSLEAVGMDLPKAAKGVLLHHEDMCACNTYDAPDTVIPQKLRVDLTKPVHLPKASILALHF